MVRQHQIRRKSNLERLGALMIQRLIDSANPTIQNSFHAWLSCPRVSPARHHASLP